MEYEKIALQYVLVVNHRLQRSQKIAGRNVKLVGAQVVARAVNSNLVNLGLKGCDGLHYRSHNITSMLNGVFFPEFLIAPRLNLFGACDQDCRRVQKADGKAVPQV
jgi:hypothetical protein